MCAIFGIVGEYNLNLAKSSQESLIHRGVDDKKEIIEENFFLAYNRLAINDIASAPQPLEYKDFFVMFNGEIYNYKELNSKFNLNANSEVEVIAKLFEKFGCEFVKRLIGMFAIAIVEGSKVYLFRDRFGKKPLFFAKSRESFIFSSEMKAITFHIKKLHLNSDAYLSYLSFLTAISPHTFYKEIKKLPPATYLIYENSHYEMKSYYSPLEAKTTITSKEKALSEIEDKLIASIEKRLLSEVEVGALLSGGVDSSLISAIVQKHFYKEKKLKTFSIGYSEYYAYDERDYARAVAEHIGSEHYEVTLTKRDFFNSIEKVLYHLDEPINDPASIPLYVLTKKISDFGLKVLLSGEGSDELFFGYRQYFEYLDIERASELKFRSWLKNYFKANFSTNKEWEWYKRIFEGSILFRSFAEKFTDLQKNMLLKMNVKDNNSLEYIDRYIKEFENSHFTDKPSWYSFIDLKVLVGEVFLNKVDRVSMANTIEVRTPFLDHGFVDTIFSIDSEIKLGDRDKTKPLLKELALKYLPSEIVNRKKKGFSYPFLEWLVNSNEFSVIREVNQKYNFFHEEGIDFLMLQAKRGKFKHHIWGLYLFCKWMKMNN